MAISEVNNKVPVILGLALTHGNEDKKTLATETNAFVELELGREVMWTSMVVGRMDQISELFTMKQSGHMSLVTVATIEDVWLGEFERTEVEQQSRPEYQKGSFYYSIELKLPSFQKCDDLLGFCSLSLGPEQDRGQLC